MQGQGFLTKNGKTAIERSYGRLVAKGELTQAAADGYLAKVQTGELELAVDADLLVARQWSRICKSRGKSFKGWAASAMSDAYSFTTNTSSLPIKEIGKGLSRSLMGMHFFNPAPAMK